MGPSKSTKRLQKNATARIMTRTNSREHIIPVLRSLHWLPISKWIEYKILPLRYQCLHETAQQHIQELVSLSPPPPTPPIFLKIDLVLSATPPSGDCNHLRIRCQHKQKAVRRKVIPQRCQTQVARDTPQCGHIASFQWQQTFRFQLLSHPPASSCLIILTGSLFPQSFLHHSPHRRPSSPPPRNTPPHAFLHHLREAQRECGCLHGVKLRCTGGHWHIMYLLNRSFRSEKSQNHHQTGKKWKGVGRGGGQKEKCSKRFVFDRSEFLPTVCR